MRHEGSENDIKAKHGTKQGYAPRWLFQLNISETRTNIKCTIRSPQKNTLGFLFISAHGTLQFPLKKLFPKHTQLGWFCMNQIQIGIYLVTFEKHDFTSWEKCVSHHLWYLQKKNTLVCTNVIDFVCSSRSKLRPQFVLFQTFQLFTASFSECFAEKSALDLPV